MFSKPIVFIVGAGASSEIGFPLGSELRDGVAKDLGFRFEVGFRQIGGSPELLEILRGRVKPGELNDFTQAGNILAAAIAPFPSIDEALHHFSHDPRIVELGKLAAALRIISAESNNVLPSGDDYEGMMRFAPESGEWLFQFFSMAISGSKLHHEGSLFENVTVINCPSSEFLRQPAV